MSSRVGRRASSRWPRLLVWPLRVVLTPVAALLLYLAAAVVGTLVPVHRDFVATPGGVRVYVVSNGVHADLWVPARSTAFDWSEWLPAEAFGGRVPSWLGLGWGEREFWLRTPTWSDLELDTALGALLWPTPTLMHVEGAWSAPAGRRVHPLDLSAEQHADLVRFLRTGFTTGADGRPVLVDVPGYRSSDRFFEGQGSYHLLRTCNHWTNEALKAAGVRTAAWAPFEQSVRYHLPEPRRDR